MDDKKKARKKINKIKLYFHFWILKLSDSSGFTKVLQDELQNYMFNGNDTRCNLMPNTN